MTDTASPPPPSDRSKVKRLPERGKYDAETVHAIVDEAPICHVGIVSDDGSPVVIPMLHARVGDTLYLHGSHGSRLLRGLKSGAGACVTFTLLDGLVMARSALHHSMNYRSVVVFGQGRDVTDDDEKWAAMEALVEQVAPGRWTEIRQPSEQEFKATALVALSLAEASAKVRTGPPVDDDKDVDGPWWAGLIPLVTTALPPEPAPDLKPGIEAGPSIGRYVAAHAREASR